MSESAQTRSVLKTLAKIGVSGVLLLYVVRSINVQAVWRVMLGTDKLLFVAAVALSIGNPIISSKKLEILLRAKAGNIPFSSVVRYYYIGKFFNAFLPSTIGGDVMKAHLLARNTSFRNAYSPVFMERFLGLLTVIGIGMVASLLYFRLLPSIVYVIIFGIYVPTIALTSLLLWWDALPAFLRNNLSGPDRITSSSIALRLIELYTAINEYKNDRGHVRIAFLLSVVHQTIVILVHYILAEAIGMSVMPVYFFVLIPIATVIVFLPISIAGIGVQEATFVFLLSLVGGTVDQAVSLSLLIHSLTLFPVSVGGIAYLFNENAEESWSLGFRREP